MPLLVLLVLLVLLIAVAITNLRARFSAAFQRLTAHDSLRRPSTRNTLALKPPTRATPSFSETAEDSDSPAPAAAPPADDIAMASMPRKILICSIGNPSPYLGTRHSAGHTLLALLVAYYDYPQLTRNRTYGAGLSSTSIYKPYTFYQSPSLMNVSGAPVALAWKGFLKELTPDERARAQLVVLHDELEKALGQVKVKVGGSAAGHNGITSIIEKLGTKDFIRVGVGIGRPESRDSRDVSKYVLSKFTSFERKGLEEVVLAKVVQALEGNKIAGAP